MSPITRRLAATPLLTLAAAALTFGAAAPPERCPAVTTADVEAAAAATTAWIVDNQQDDGTWLYEYDRSTGRAEYFATGDYNIVRHAGVMMSLYQAATHGIPGALDSADRGLEWALEHSVERHGWVGVYTGTAVQAGTNALMAAALVERREATGDTQHDALLGQLGRFLEGQVEPSGAVLGYYDLGPDQPRPDVYSIYYTGEAWWALARLHRAFPGDGWGTVADRVGHYLATSRDDAENLWPPLADHWSGYGLGETAQFPDRPLGRPLTDAEVEFARRQGGLVGQRVRSISQRFGPWGVAVRGTFEPRGGGYGVFGEGLGGLWQAAQADDRLADLRTPLADRQVCIVGLALDALVTPTEAATYPTPEFVQGAWFQNEVTRMDDQQHALSALFATIPILHSPGEITGTSPSGWLWLVAVIGVLNPALGALAIRRSARSIAAPVVAAGVLGGVAVLFGIGALSGWLLGVLDVSTPAIRLAAAGLCAVAVIIDLAVGPRRAAGAADVPAGWLGALTPVAVPNVVRTPLVIVGLSVVADHGLPFYGLTLVLAAGLLVLLATAPGRLPEGVAGWTARLLSGLGMAAALLLVAHAVFTV
ncbi:MAG TPA: hypothetical protein VNQ73_15690 [Ilumatobacter sp.]|nr:hypothetical protein [Ilumatobacter sp.]